jgi:hypothetical protein
VKQLELVAFEPLMLICQSVQQRYRSLTEEKKENEKKLKTQKKSRDPGHFRTRLCYHHGRMDKTVGAWLNLRHNLFYGAGNSGMSRMPSFCKKVGRWRR